MPRRPRKKSSNGVYHVMLRGVNKQVIFEDEKDRFKLLSLIKKCKNEDRFNVYAYCLMDNHIHLLIRETGDNISSVMHRISTGYVFWYNKKYECNGHLFQNRFRSEPVEHVPSFMRVLRYIHRNPVKAGLAKDVNEYPWSSFHEFSGLSTLIDSAFSLQLFSSDKNEALRLFTDYMQTANKDEFLEDKTEIKMSDQEVLSYLEKSGFPNKNRIQQMEKKERDALISQMKHLKGVSIRQLARVTGISKSVIGRV